MKRFQSLQEIMEFIRKTHTNFVGSGNNSHYGLKMLRQPDGSRLIFSETREYILDSYEIRGENGLVLVDMRWGATLNPAQKGVCKTWLYDLAIINVYDYAAEFLSAGAIDFAYVLESYAAKLTIGALWIHNKQDPVRAQWKSKYYRDPFIDELISGPIQDMDKPIEARRSIDLSSGGLF